MTRFGRLTTLIAIGLLAAVGVGSVLASPGGVLFGDSDNDGPSAQTDVGASPNQVAAGSLDDAHEVEIDGDVIECAFREDTRFEFEREDGEFEVKGLLVSLDGSAVVVLGPDGDVTAAVGSDTEMEGDPQPGDPVKVEGSVLGDGSFLAREIEDECADDADAADLELNEDDDEVEDAEECNRGPGEAGDLRLEIDGVEVEVERGSVLSFTDGALTVDTPIGSLTILIDAGTEVDGDLSLAVEARVKGTLTDGGSVLADEVKALCPDAAHHGDDDGDVDDSDDDDDDDDDHSGHQGDEEDDDDED